MNDLTNSTNFQQQELSEWFAAGRRLRVKDLEGGHEIVGRDGRTHYILARTTSEDGTHELITKVTSVKRFGVSQSVTDGVEITTKYEADADLDACFTG